MGKKFLGAAYVLDHQGAAKDLYEDWAATYDAEIQENGYVTPRRCATALAAMADDLSAPLLDLGCGTGLSGLALRAAGFTTIDGVDISPSMLRRAEALPGVYRKTKVVDIGAPVPAAPEEYRYVNAAGVISPEHAPAEAVDEILAVLPSKGCLVFSLNDHALADPTFPGKVAEVVEQGRAFLEFEEYGDHLPGIGLNARVYGLRKP